MATKTKPTLDEISVAIAGVSNRNKEYANSFYWHSRTLYLREDDGRFYFQETGGAAMAVSRQIEYVARNEALEFVATEATDAITGYGYTIAQAELMLSGREGCLAAGEGWRDLDEIELHPQWIMRKSGLTLAQIGVWLDEYRAKERG